MRTKQIYLKRQIKEKKPETLWSDLIELVNKHPWLKHLITFGAGITAGLIAATSLLESKLESIAEKRLTPYEALFSGLSLNQGEEYENAIQEFKKVIQMKKFDSFPSETKSLTYDGLLLAIVNADEPNKYQPELNSIKSRMGIEVEETAWRSHTLGWYFIKTGDNISARKYFNNAKTSYELRREYSSSIDPMRGLLILALIENNPDEAVDIGYEIIARNPAAYRDASDLIAEIQTIQKDRLFDKYNALYGEKLNSTIKKYIQKLKSKNTIEQNIKKE